MPPHLKFNPVRRLVAPTVHPPDGIAPLSNVKLPEAVSPDKMPEVASTVKSYIIEEPLAAPLMASVTIAHERVLLVVIRKCHHVSVATKSIPVLYEFSPPHSLPYSSGTRPSTTAASFPGPRDDDRLVFTSPEGGEIDYSNWHLRRWNALLKATRPMRNARSARW